MDTAITATTTTDQNLITTNVHTLSISSNNNSNAADSIVQNSSSSFIKNKRKNFNPRYSSAMTNDTNLLSTTENNTVIVPSSSSSLSPSSPDYQQQQQNLQQSQSITTTSQIKEYLKDVLTVPSTSTTTISKCSQTSSPSSHHHHHQLPSSSSTPTTKTDEIHHHQQQRKNLISQMEKFENFQHSTTTAAAQKFLTSLKSGDITGDHGSSNLDHHNHNLSINENLKQFFELHRNAAIASAAAAAASANYQNSASSSTSNEKLKQTFKLNTKTKQFNDCGNNIEQKLSNDPQAKIEFAYNAFNAVQELLNVYGLSISPGDIVDAFKKQSIGGGCPQPPTPPRTPVSTVTSSAASTISSTLAAVAATATAAANHNSNGFFGITRTSSSQLLSSSSTLATSALIHQQNATKDNEIHSNSSSRACNRNEDDNENFNCSSIVKASSSPPSSSSSSSLNQNAPLISLAPISKLMDMSSMKTRRTSIILNNETTKDNNIKISNNQNCDDINNDNNDDDDDIQMKHHFNENVHARKDSNRTHEGDDSIDNEGNNNETTVTTMMTRKIENNKSDIENDDNEEQTKNDDDKNERRKRCSGGESGDNNNKRNNSNNNNNKNNNNNNNSSNNNKRSRNNIDNVDDDCNEEENDENDHDDDDNDDEDEQQDNKNRNKKLKYSQCYDDDDENMQHDNEDEDRGDDSSDTIISSHRTHHHHHHRRRHHRLRSNSNQFDDNYNIGENDDDDDDDDENDSNISTTADLQSYDGSDDFGLYNGGISSSINQIDYDSGATTTTTSNTTGTTGKLSVKSVESLLDKCSLGLFSPFLQLAQMHAEDKQINAENLKNLTKFSSYIECKNEQCQIENLREHYHCYDEPCYGKILSKKEEIIRHIKWHKKRNESLNHGFLRFSSSDDCSVTFGINCQHNRKQTHYHCFQPNCDKVYISTSDVQMHSNYHRKDSAIYQEGFQRYRATEECNVDYCAFSGQRTTHFHCRRNNCRYTFKNKADMEKHKSYHIKDLQLARDGFKKFLKTESCPFEQCRFSRICNHIHCVRENCYYVLHSSGQLLSHKRKHERMDSEQAYRRFRMLQKASVFASATGQDLSQFTKNLDLSSKSSTPSTPPLSALSPELQLSNVAHNLLNNPNALPSDLSVAFASSATSTTSKSEDSSSDNIPSGLRKSVSSDNAPIDLSILYNNSNLPLGLIQEMQQQQQQQQHRQRQHSTDDPPGIGSSGGGICPTKPLSILNPALLPALSSSISSSSQNNNSMLQENVLMSMMLANSTTNFNNDDSIRANPIMSDTIEHLINQYFTDNCTRQNTSGNTGGANVSGACGGGGGNDGGDGIGTSKAEQIICDQQQQQTEPLNLNLKNGCNSTTGNSNSTTEDNKNGSGQNNDTTGIIECFLSTNEAHLHCLIKDCEAVISRNLSDIAEHLRIHKLNRNVENIMNNSNLLQITSIEGFFNRKRGRPPKNRVVEVYNNNTQQSPQAIFTSFKLEKSANENLNSGANSTHGMNTRSSTAAAAIATSTTSSTIIPSTSASTCVNDNNLLMSDIHHQMIVTSSSSSSLTPLSSSSTTATTATSINRSSSNNSSNFHSTSSSTLQIEKKFRVFEHNENCGFDYCLYPHQMHFHCNVNYKICQFVTRFGRAMDVHLMECHNISMINPTISNDNNFTNITLNLLDNQKLLEKFQYFDLNDDCGLMDCNNKMIRNHLHCLKCRKTIISQLELQTHMCMCYSSDNNLIEIKNEISNNPTKSLRDIKKFDLDDYRYQNRTRKNSGCGIEGGSGGIDYPSSSSSIASFLKKSEETEMMDSTMKSESSEDEHVSVVRASGTYFPQNSDDKSVLYKIDETSYQQGQSDSVCQRPFCKLKRKTHEHCELCNQAFSDKTRLKIHRMKHTTTRLGNLSETETTKSHLKTHCETPEKEPIMSIKNESINMNKSGGSSCIDSSSDQPQDLSLITSPQHLLKSPVTPSSSSSAPTPTFPAQNSPNSSTTTTANATAGAAALTNSLQQILPQNFMDNFCMQNLHLAQMALYQQNPFYYQNFYPFLGPQTAAAAAAAAAAGLSLNQQTELFKSQFELPSTPVKKSGNGGGTGAGNASGGGGGGASIKPPETMSSGQFPFAEVAAAAAAALQQAAVSGSGGGISGCGAGGTSGMGGGAGGGGVLTSTIPSSIDPNISPNLMLSTSENFALNQKRKATCSIGGDSLSGYNALIEQMQPKKLLKTNKQGNFKIFKDEPIPHGYLKFRFNEDCNFPNCGYRNHQSHFHCCRNDCYYSFCDKTRFVQHTARHERLDKLMGDDFKQYRANMRCGYDNCAYNKNIAGQNNKSSHFHCLICNFICSDTNKVVAHRRQHEKMAYIRMAGFRKVSNNEKCNSLSNDNIQQSVSSAGAGSTSSSITTTSSNGECTYSLKQTHYHCLICNCSVLSKAQLGSHRHRVS